MDTHDDNQVDPTSATAWILGFGRSHIAVGEFEVLHILDQRPERFPIPQTPGHCREVILWEEQIVPLLDLTVLAEDSHGQHSRQDHGEGAAKQIVAIVGFQSRANEVPGYGALLLSKIPQRYTVQDDLASAFPSESPGLNRFTLCSFAHPEYGYVRVLDVPRLFAASARNAHRTYEAQ